MTAGPKEIIWDAEAHTIAKIRILEEYLKAYFLILGRTQRKLDFLYIDGFAGPNAYINFKYGSPSAALNAVQSARTQLGPEWIAGTINCAFVESDRRRYEYLVQSLPKPAIDGTYVQTYNAEFAAALNDIRGEFTEPFDSAAPLFAFIDPFGATGAPFEAVASILASPRSEVLLNLDADGIVRLTRANNESHLTQIFGDQSWRGKFDAAHSFHESSREVLQIYKARLRTLPGVEYIWQVEMRGRSDTLNYFLVFAMEIDFRGGHEDGVLF